MSTDVFRSRYERKNWLMKKIMFISLLLLWIYKGFGQANFCAVFAQYENDTIDDVINHLEKWCKIKISYDFVPDQNIRISGKFEGIPIQKALDRMLEGTNIGFSVINESTIELTSKKALVKYILISGKYKNTPLIDIFNNWKRTYDIHLEYDLSEINNVNIFGELKNEPLEDALDKILSSTELEYTVITKDRIRINKSINPLVTQYLDFENISRNINVSGTIRDRITGETLPFANIIEKGTTNGTSTNVDGYFTLFEVSSDTSVLELSYIGYQSSQIRLRPDLNLENLDLTLDAGSVEIEEITIAAVKIDQMLKASTGISKVAMTPEITSILPSYGDRDIFRSLQLLPGVSGTNESSSGLFVRGGTPDQNLILFDGFTVYHVDHLFGFYSAFNSNAIKDVQLHKGGFESKFGGRLSSVVEMTGKDGNTNDLNMGFGASLLSLNGFIESPFANGKGSVIVTGRRSFQSSFYSNLFDSFTNIGPQAEETTPQGGGPFGGRGGFGGFGQTQVQPNSYFYDLNAKLTYRFNSREKVSISLYNGVDDLDNSRITDSNSLGSFGPFGGGNANISFINDNIDLSNWGNLGGSIKWGRQWSDRFYSNATVSFSNYFSDRERNNETNITREDSTIVRRTGSFETNDLKDLTFKWDNELKLSQNNQVDFGFQITHNDIQYDYTQNDTISLVSRADEGVTAAFYIQDKLTFGKSLIINTGIRFSNYSLTDKLYVEPRASALFLLNNRIKLKGAYGQYNQFATRVVREDIQQGSRDFWILADDQLIPTSSSTHYILGASYETEGLLLDVEGFRKNYDGLSEYTNRLESSGFGPNQTLSIEEQFFTGSGYAQGIEFLLQKKFGKFTGWAGYTLSEVKYDFEAFGDDSFYANQDQRHELKIVGALKLDRFDLSSTFVYGTGRPYTAPIGFYELTLLDDLVEPYFQVSDKNALRYPAYHRWDISANYNFNIGTSKAQIGLSIFNLYNRTNTWYKEYEVIDGQLLETDVSLLGLTPSLFFNWTLK